MNEQDLKRAFEDVVVASSPPPSMDPGRALEAARKARSKRRSSITGALVAVLVVGVGLGTAFALNPKATTEYMTGAAPSSSSSAAWPGRWPEGQSDRTATKGPQADRANKLLEELKGVVPAGYDAPQLKYQDPSYAGGDMQRTQGQVASDRGEVPEVWEYMAQTPVRKDGKVGWLLAESSTPDPELPTDPCALARAFWGMGGPCRVVDVKGLKVGVVQSNPSGRDQFDKWATYRAQDGQVVTIAQDDKYLGGDYPELDGPLFTEEQLAELATDPRFRMGD
ncbi:hypothetical protein C8D87_110262 [Lentzea atacamensis]|uniref:Uncharacterized protein n=1 Tax=Lentzea atacamensis TaxID=531938 RepID=A0ABX9E1Y1_9PSEU|nr:hypothetical protein [Lentzea atacamensis]RAS61313.1 hypothetical protein C8D87_110262 [Lentzea atacamensis]